MINKIDFKAKNLTSNAGLFLLLQYTKNEGIFDMIEENLIFDNAYTNKIKMNHIKTMICGHFIGIDKLERLKLLQNDPLINVERYQEGAMKGCNPKKAGNRCYNIQFAFCDELKSYITGFMRSGNTYTANGASEMIKEIVANIKDENLEILLSPLAASI